MSFRIACFLLTLILTSTSALRAATLSVTTTADLVADDGACSLREALNAANQNLPGTDCPGGDPLPIIDEIELPIGVYSLTLGLPGDDSNGSGDLDITESVVIRGLGDDFVWWDDPATSEAEVLDVFAAPLDWMVVLDRGPRPATVIENGFGDPIVVGDGDRVIHVAPHGEAGVEVTLENLTLRGGDLGCASETCNFGAAGVYSQSDGMLSLIRSAVVENQLSCTGENCGQVFDSAHSAGAAAVAALGGGGLSLDRSVVVDNRAFCSSLNCRAASILLTEAVTDSGGLPLAVGDLLISHTLIGRNLQTCDGQGQVCRIDEGFRHFGGAMTLNQAVMTENEMACFSPGCEIDEMIEPKPVRNQNPSQPTLQLTDVEISHNVIDGAGGYDPVKMDPVGTDEILDSADWDAQHFQRARFSFNNLSCQGESCDIDEVVDISGHATLTDVVLTGNVLTCSSPSCFIRGLFNHGPGDAPASVYSGLSLEQNQLGCVGDGCRVDPQLEIAGGTVSLLALGAQNNTNAAQGASSSVGGIIRLESELAILEGTAIADNATKCSGLDCFVGPRQEGVEPPIPESGLSLGGALVLAGRSKDLDRYVIRGSTMTGQMSTGDGAGLSVGPEILVQLFDVQITGNESAGSVGGVFNRGILSRGDALLAGNLPAGTDCVDSGAGIGCSSLLIDGFESGDASAWSSTIP